MKLRYKRQVHNETGKCENKMNLQIDLKYFCEDCVKFEGNQTIFNIEHKIVSWKMKYEINIYKWVYQKNECTAK